MVTVRWRWQCVVVMERKSSPEKFSGGGDGVGAAVVVAAGNREREKMRCNVDSSVKFLMYPRFVQVFLDQQVGDMSTHDENFVTPSHTKKVFGNMKRVGKGFSGAVTPLFLTMMVQAHEEVGEGSKVPSDP
ncbi:hypothetical protein Tco_1551203 [Tanacetum coccineum]